MANVRRDARSVRDGHGAMVLLSPHTATGICGPFLLEASCAAILERDGELVAVPALQCFVIPNCLISPMNYREIGNVVAVVPPELLMSDW